MERTSFNRCLTNVRILLLDIPSLYSIFFLYYNSIIITHFLLSLLSHFHNINNNNNNDNDNDNDNDTDDEKEEQEEEEVQI